MKNKNFNINFYKLAFLFLQIYAFVLPVDVILSGSNNIAYSNYIAIIFVLASLLEFIMKKKIYIRNFKDNVFLIIFPIYAILTIFFRQNEKTSFSLIVSFLVSYMLFFFAMLHNYNDDEKRKLIKIIEHSTIVVWLALIFFGNTNMNGRLNLSNGQRTMDPNYFVVGLSLLVSIKFFKILNRESNIVNVIELLSLLLISFMTGSRGGLIAILFAMLVLFLFSNIKTKNKIMFIVVMPIFVLILFKVGTQIIPQNVLERFSLENIEKGRGTGRIDIWIHALKMYSNNNVFRILFGSGFGTFQSVYSYDGHIAHNTFIQVLTEFGAIGFMFFVIMLCKVLIKLIKDKNYVLLSCVIGFLGGAMSLNLITYRAVWFVIFLIYVDIYKGNMKVKNEENAKNI